MNDLFEIYVENAPDIIVFLDENQVACYVNEAGRKFAQFKVDDKLDDMIKKTKWPITADQVMSQSKAMNVPRNFITSNAHIHNGSAVRWFIHSCQSKLIIVGENMSEVESLKKDNFMLSQVIRKAPSMIYWKDQGSSHLGCNEIFAKNAGLNDPVEVVGLTDFDLSWPSVAASYQADDAEVIKTGREKLKIEDEMPLPSGKKIIVLTNKMPLRDEEENIIGVVGTATDITELKEAQKELKSALKRAQKANAEREKVLLRYRQFVEDQEHDIRTPLGNVAAGTDYLLSEITAVSDELMSLLKGINTSAGEILHYQESLLYSLYEDQRNGYTIFSRFDLPKIINHVFNINLASAKIKDLTYTYSYDDSIPSYLLGDSKKVYQCLLDLLSNAVRFTTDGIVRLVIECLDKNQKQVVVRFSVIDTGEGIPKEKQGEIYEAFVKAKPSNKGGERGRGLGLTRVNTHANQMGGELRFNSELGKGSCFRLTLPFKVSLDQTKCS